MQPITMTLREGRDGLDVAEAVHAGERFTATSRNGATMKLARALVEAGAGDGPVEARGADGRLRFTSPSLHRLARWTIAERDRGGLGMERFKTGPGTYREGVQDGADGSGRVAQTAEGEAA